ncbi:mce-related protein [Dissulfurispira thermophila]|uniref:Mce-related protein n=2 Tax=root TaxID=1 RepID=A0A7G1H2D3_9BACT|nr:MlaD family protein [Dissulfurispira thermophila]BCB96974.1 mce-related protein [Dissulfurispira thermophila]
MFDVKKEFMWSKLKVGIVVTSALLLLLFAVFFAGGIEDVFSPKIEIKAQIKDVRGLRKGSPVWISGIEIGAVKGISLHAEHGTIVTMSIDKKSAKYIRKDSTVTVQTIGLLGDKYIEISHGSPDVAPVSHGDVIKGVEQIEIKDIVKAGSIALSKITEFIGDLNVFLKKIEKSATGIANSKFLTDPQLYNDLRDASKSLSTILKDFKDSDGTVKKLIEDPSLYNKMLSAASSVETFGKKVTEGDGSLKKLAEDPMLYENLSKASKQLSEILEKIEAGEGVAGSLVKDKKLENEFKESVSELKTLTKDLSELVKDIKANPKKYFKFSVF